MAKYKGASSIYAEREINGNLVSNETNPVTVAGVFQVLRPDPERAQWVLYNLGATAIYLGFTADVSATNGFLIPPSGGFINMNLISDFEAVILPVYAFCAVAGNQLYTFSTRRESSTAGV